MKVLNVFVYSLRRMRYKLLKRVLTSYFNRRIEAHKTKMLFIIGHMRSGSTLLLHILNSNKEIVGYGETQSHYHLKKDFGTVASNIFLNFKRIPKNEEYILDKVLHSNLLSVEDAEILKDQKVLFQLREPQGALSSICDMYTKFGQHANDKNEFAVNYYKERMLNIIEFAQKIPLENWEMVTYSDLVRNSKTVFHRIERFLGLENNLTEDYDTMFSTGTPVTGDYSDNIKAGKIQKRKARVVDSSLVPFVEEADIYYKQCVRTLTLLKAGKSMEEINKPTPVEEKPHKELSLQL